MTTAEYEKTFVERIYDEGEAKGEARGEARGEAKALLRLLDKRKIALSDEQREKVQACADAAQLDVWFDRAITAGSAAEVFAD